MYNNALCQHLNSSYTSRSLYGHIMWCQNRTKYSAFEMSSVTKLAFELTQRYTTRRHDNTSKSWLCAGVLCDGVVTLHSACAVELLHMALSGHHNETLLCVFWRESFDMFSYRYQFITNCLHCRHFPLELWNDIGAWILDKLLGLSRQWLTSNKHIYMYMINTIQPTDFSERKVIKEPLREF